MNLAFVLQVINIIVIMLLAAYQMRIILRMKKYGCYWSVIRYIRYKDRRGINWFKSNPVYFVHWIFLGSLLFLDITFIGQLLSRDIMNGLLLKAFLPLAWLCVLFYFMLTEEAAKAESSK